MKKRLGFSTGCLLFIVFFILGCRSTYYSVWEQLGKEKRHLLRDNVENARNEQEQASEQFKDALTQLKELYGFHGGDLEDVIIKEEFMECKKEEHLQSCNCSYEPCARKGICCECLNYHLNSRELPACCFPNDAERTYDRSFEHFARLVTERSV